ncbi:MAG: ECF-type sigma factor [Gemmataceae bacterium]
MASQHSVTHWITLLRDGDTAAAQHLWERYFAQLVTLARRKLHGTSRGAADEEDVALSAFHSFCVAARQFPRLNNRDDLWQVLVMLTARKAYQERRRQQTLKRGGALTEDGQRRSPLASSDDLHEIIGSEPTPEFAMLLADQFEAMLRVLPDDQLRQIARLRLEESSNAEIAQALGCSERTIERKLQLIRGFWEEHLTA